MRENPCCLSNNDFRDKNQRWKTWLASDTTRWTFAAQVIYGKHPRTTLTFKDTVKETLLALSTRKRTLRQKEELRLVCVIMDHRGAPQTVWESGGGSANGKVSSQRRFFFFLPWDCFNQALPLLNNAFDTSWLVGLILHSLEPTRSIKPCVNIKSRILATFYCCPAPLALLRVHTRWVCVTRIEFDSSQCVYFLHWSRMRWVSKILDGFLYFTATPATPAVRATLKRDHKLSRAR